MSTRDEVFTAIAEDLEGLGMPVARWALCPKCERDCPAVDVTDVGWPETWRYECPACGDVYGDRPA